MPGIKTGIGVGVGRQGALLNQMPSRDGLVGAWDFTNISNGAQSVPGALGTIYAAQLGSTSGVDASDPTIVSKGLQY